MEKQCFLVTPIGSETDKDIQVMRENINLFIEPVLNEKGYSLIDSSNISNTGMITHQIIDHLVNDELVIVNLYGLNANVMYEMGVRHSTGKPCIHICDDGRRLPFDISDYRTLFYRLDAVSMQKFGRQFAEMLATVQDGVLADNPVFSAAKMTPLGYAPESEEGLFYIANNHAKHPIDLVHTKPLFAPPHQTANMLVANSVDLSHYKSLVILQNVTGLYQNMRIWFSNSKNKSSVVDIPNCSRRVEADVSDLVGEYRITIEMLARRDISAVTQIEAIFFE